MTTHRTCGDCTLCCRLLPMPEFDKPAGAPCKHQCSTGCRIYERKPVACSLWNCRWLVDDDAADLKRPDRGHYVVDLMPDFVEVTADDGSGQTVAIGVVQVWVDPAYPDAHRDPGLRRYLAKIGARDRDAALIRYGSKDGFVLMPPSMMNTGDWHEAHTLNTEAEHTLAETALALGSAVTLKVRQ